MGAGEVAVQFTLGVTEDGKVIVNFGTAKVDHILLTPEQALEWAEGILETAQLAALGRATYLKANGRG